VKNPTTYTKYTYDDALSTTSGGSFSSGKNSGFPMAKKDVTFLFDKRSSIPCSLPGGSSNNFNWPLL